MQTKNHLQALLMVAKVPPLEQLLQSKRATNVFNQVYHVTVATLVVRLHIITSQLSSHIFEQSVLNTRLDVLR